MRVQESSVKKSANAVLKVHDDSVVHLINTYDVHVHTNIVTLFPVNVSPMQNNRNAKAGRMNAANCEQFLNVASAAMLEAWKLREDYLADRALWFVISLM